MSDQRIYEEEIVYGAVTSSSSVENKTPDKVFDVDEDKVTFKGKLHLTEKEYEKFKSAKIKNDKIKEEEEEKKKKKEKKQTGEDDLII